MPEKTLSSRQAKRRVEAVDYLLQNFVTKDGNISAAQNVYNLAAKKMAVTLNQMTSERAGVKIRQFDAITLAALEEQAGLTYSQSVILRYFMKSQGAGALFDSNCTEKKVRAAKRKAGSTIQYTVGNCHVFSKTEDSEIEKEISYLVVANFNAAFAWWVADEDRRGTYRALSFHKLGKFLVSIGGDTGGRHFKFVVINTHKEHGNSGKQCNVWFMSDKFKETNRNLSRVLLPSIGKDFNSIIQR